MELAQQTSCRDLRKTVEFVRNPVDLWNCVWELLPNRKRVGASWLPYFPLILEAWSDILNVAKLCGSSTTFFGPGITERWITTI